MSLSPPEEELPDVIRCVECDGDARRLPYRPEDGWEPGDVVVYRCEDCGERWDIEV